MVLWILFSLHMASSQSNGLRTPFQDLTNTGNSGQRADPKELKRQRERERYALNRDEILKRRREARDHILKVKVNCPVILLRNLDPHNGLCNGTRLMIKALQDNAIDAEIVGGQHAGKRVFIPRIPLSPSEDISLPFKLKRKQFPIRLSFAMTINKAHGQTIPNVGIYLPEPVFSHGQLYVALSRGVSR